MTQLKIIHISWRKCVVSFSVNTWSVKGTYWKNSFVQCLTMNTAREGETFRCLFVCVLTVSHKVVTFVCRVVHHSDGLCGDIPIGENITKGNNGVILKCCIPHHYTSTSNQAKNRY